VHKACIQGIVWRRLSRFQFPIFQRSRAEDRKNPHAKRIKVHNNCHAERLRADQAGIKPGTSDLYFVHQKFILKRNTPQLAATGIKGIRIQLRLGSALPGPIFMRRRLGCPAACCAWVRRRRFTNQSIYFLGISTITDLILDLIFFSSSGEISSMP